MNKLLNFFTMNMLTLCCIVSNAFGSCSKSDIQLLNDHLNSFKTLVTNFSEIHAAGEKHGRILIHKPGMMKIEYSKPTRISIVIHDDVVSYYDHELNELTKIKQNPKFLTFLSRNKIDLSKDFDSFACDVKGVNTDVVVTLKEQEETVNLTLRFLQHNLNNVLIKTKEGTKSLVKFQNMLFNYKINVSEFELRDKNFFNME